MEQICETLFERCLPPFKACLKDAELSSAQIDELVLVGGMTRMPKVVDIARQLGGKPPHQGVNPDEVVAIGAAVQGGVLKGEVRDVHLLDDTPLTLGIETAGQVATAMIPRNTTIPSKKTQVFSTYSDSQPSVDIVVLQGERPMSRDNKVLGTYVLKEGFNAEFLKYFFKDTHGHLYDGGFVSEINPNMEVDKGNPNEKARLLGMLAAVAGVFAGITVQLRPTLGVDLLLPLFAAVILGGIGSVWGAVLGGFIVGLAESASVSIVGAEYRAAAAFAVLILILMVRPTGLFPEKH
jgi:hypothetical protein